MEYLSHDFGPDFECKVLDMIILDETFISDFKSIINPDAFHSENNSYLVQTVLSYHEEYNKTPSVAVLMDLVWRGTYRDKGGVIEYLKNITPISDREYVRDRLISWTKWSAIDDVLQSHNGDLPNEFANRIASAARIGDGLLLNHTKLDVDIEDSDVREPIIPTPWSWLNSELDGGPELGDLAVVLTVISGGKTTVLINIARHALALGKFVVYFTFEDGEKKIRRRMIQSIANVSKQELAADKAQIIKRKNRFLVKSGGRCEIKDLPSRRCTVDDAASLVRTIEDSAERKVDMVITDYADRFKPHGKYSEPRHALREIFEDCKWLARNLNVVHWTARQVNKSLVGKDVIGVDAAGESWGSMESPDLVIGLGRTLEDENMSRITLYTAKVRDEHDHQLKSLFTDFERQRIWDTAEE